MEITVFFEIVEVLIVALGILIVLVVVKHTFNLTWTTIANFATGIRDKSKVETILAFIVCIGLTVVTLFSYGYKCYQTGPGFEYLGYYECTPNYSFVGAVIRETLPGLLFSFYVVYYFIEDRRINRKIFHFAGLYLFYLVTWFVARPSFGLLNIATGAIGLYIVNKSIQTKYQYRAWFVISIGALTGLLGLLAVYQLGSLSGPQPTQYTGLTYLFACLPWQISSGTLLIYKKLKSPNDGGIKSNGEVAI